MSTDTTPEARLRDILAKVARGWTATVVRCCHWTCGLATDSWADSQMTMHKSAFLIRFI